MFTIHRPFKDLSAEKTLSIGNEAIDVKFDVEDAMDAVIKSAQVAINKINALYDRAYEVVDQSFDGDENIVYKLEQVLVLATAIKVATMEDIGDWDAALEEAGRDFDPQKEWGTY